MEKKRMENKMQDSERNRKDFLMDMVKRVYSDDMNLIDLDRELVDKLDDFIASEISKAREEGRREVIHKLKEEIDMAEVSKFIDAHQDFFNRFGKSMLLKISKLNKKK